MALADRARTPVVVITTIKPKDEPEVTFRTPITCHVATLFWAALEARGNATPGDYLQIVKNITSQGDITALLYKMRSFRTWDFDKTKTTPPPGTVLFWGDHDSANHSATVVADKLIAGHNQGHQFNDVRNTDYCLKHYTEIKENCRRVHLISERTLVKKARDLRL